VLNLFASQVVRKQIKLNSFIHSQQLQAFDSLIGNFIGDWLKAEISSKYFNLIGLGMKPFQDYNYIKLCNSNPIGPEVKWFHSPHSRKIKLNLKCLVLNYSCLVCFDSLI
jgi:hypothetical protein